MQPIHHPGRRDTRRSSIPFRFLPLVLAGVVALGGCGVVSFPESGSSSGSGAAAETLESLTVAEAGAADGYDRDLFPHWIGQGDGCDTRDVVLQRDGEDVVTGESCEVVSGTWYSPYDGASTTDAGDLDIDHMVPLAEAWRSGADAWDEETRSAFANDLTRPQLLAVSASANRAKGDRGPAEWQPDNQDYLCAYAEDWITVKAHWDLTVTPAERDALVEMLATC